MPALSGLGAPYWDPQAKGAFFGLTRGTKKEQIVRATLEGIAFSVADLYQCMAKGSTTRERVLRVDGGACANDLLMQFQSDILQTVVDRPSIIETTAFGAALFAGLGAGMYSSIEDLAHLRQSEKLFHPATDMRETLDAQVSGWHRAVAATRVFSGDGK